MTLLNFFSEGSFPSYSRGHIILYAINSNSIVGCKRVKMTLSAIIPSHPYHIHAAPQYFLRFENEVVRNFLQDELNTPEKRKIFLITLLELSLDVSDKKKSKLAKPLF